VSPHACEGEFSRTTVQRQITRAPLVPTGVERNIEPFRRAGGELGIEVDELPRGFVRLSLVDRDSYPHLARVLRFVQTLPKPVVVSLRVIPSRAPG
jgi:hypothetical protein